MAYFTLTLFLISLPACFAITAAHKAGYCGWCAYVVWSLEQLAGLSRRGGEWMAGKLLAMSVRVRKFHQELEYRQWVRRRTDHAKGL